MNYEKWLDKNIQSLKGKIYIVTGANSGIGYQLTLHLASLDASVIMACRSIEKASKAKIEILKAYPNANIYLEEYNQASFDSINKFALKIKNDYSHIDGLVCNAGVYFPKKDYKTEDGFELTIGTNYIGVYKLIEDLKDYLDMNKARVVLVNSLVSRFARNISLEKAFNLKRNSLYNYSKCAVARLGYELMKEDNDITYRIAHPGVCSTNIISSNQTGFPTWFGVLGHKALTLFTHSARKASLSLLLALVDNGEKKYITPRGLFSISGCPKRKKLPRFMDKPLIEETSLLLTKTIGNK